MERRSGYKFHDILEVTKLPAFISKQIFLHWVCETCYSRDLQTPNSILSNFEKLKYDYVGWFYEENKERD